MRARLRSWGQFIKTHRVTFQFIAIFLAIAIILILIGYLFDWTGFGRYSIIWTPKATNGTSLPIRLEEQQPAKTLWDWLQLLIIPAVLAAGGIWFSSRQKRHELQIADSRSQDATLETYLSKMSELLLDKDFPLRKAEPDSEVRQVAQAWTLTILPRLNGDRKGAVIEFLDAAELLRARNKKQGESVVSLSSADLREVQLPESTMAYVDLSWTDLTRANLRAINLWNSIFDYSLLRQTNLYAANIWGCSFSMADLREADLRIADLSNTDLSKAVFTGANLRQAQVTDAQLKRAESLEGAIMPDGRSFQGWTGFSYEITEDEHRRARDATPRALGYDARRRSVSGAASKSGSEPGS